MRVSGINDEYRINGVPSLGAYFSTYPDIINERDMNTFGAFDPSTALTQLTQSILAIKQQNADNALRKLQAQTQIAVSTQRPNSPSVRNQDAPIFNPANQIPPAAPGIPLWVILGGAGGLLFLLMNKKAG